VNCTLLWKPRRLAAAVRGKLDARRTMNQAIKAGQQRFKNDPNYRPDLVPQFFLPRPGIAQDDSIILKRIIAAYQKAKAEQRSASEAFNVSNEWLPIYERNLGPVMKALLDGDTVKLQRMYQNFFRDPCSTGLSGLPVDMFKCYFGGSIKSKHKQYFLSDALHRYELWKERTEGAYNTDVLASADVGNPYGHTRDGVFVKTCADYQHYYAQAIAQLSRSSEKRVVAELGGGFGGMAYYLRRDHPSLTYVDFDLPETLALASYYLLKSLQDLKITLYGEADLVEALGGASIIMMPSFEIMKMPPKSVAVSFNSYSLAEMSPSTIRVYITQIARTTEGHFLHVNHNKNAVLAADNFGIEDHGFKLVSRRLARWTLGINAKSDEYEYLYKS
jgi:putative sugar O-methyltransferase